MSPPTRAGSVREGLWLHAALAISPSAATAGRHRRVCVAISRSPHPHLLESGLDRSPSFTHQRLCQRQRPSLRWIRAYPAQCDIETPSGDGVVALDPGVRTFLTYFSEADCGKLGHHAFGRIQRLCHWLDDLISRTTKEPHRRKRRQMRSAQARMRQRITNLVDELHWQLARWLTSNYRIILLPTFETQDMTQRAGRRIRSKTARMMLTFRHYEFKQRLQWKAWQRGALVLDVNEAYTSKTRSWDGTVNTKLGGAKVIRDETGFGMDRDVNGARGIFLRALGDSPFLRGLLTQDASQPTATSSNVV